MSVYYQTVFFWFSSTIFASSA